jgi:hypothetical protein
MLPLTWLVGIADARDSGAMSRLDVGEGVADEGSGGGVGVQSVDGFVDQVRAGLE